MPSSRSICSRRSLSRSRSRTRSQTAVCLLKLSSLRLSRLPVIVPHHPAPALHCFLPALCTITVRVLVDAPLFSLTHTCYIPSPSHRGITHDRHMILTRNFNPKSRYAYTYMHTHISIPPYLRPTVSLTHSRRPSLWPILYLSSLLLLRRCTTPAILMTI